MDNPERQLTHSGAIDNRLTAYKQVSGFFNPSFRKQRLYGHHEGRSATNYYKHFKTERHDWGEDINSSGFTNPADYIGDRRLTPRF
jgi:hypothetical protein|tara:strand:- start:364 stop:621 length:258 start_codon:yes stop_codon:yes gene_type:complete